MCGLTKYLRINADEPQLSSCGLNYKWKWTKVWINRIGYSPNRVDAQACQYRKHCSYSNRTPKYFVNLACNSPLHAKTCSILTKEVLEKVWKIYLLTIKTPAIICACRMSKSNFFFYLGFLSRTFTNHRTAGEGGGHFLNSSLPLSSASQTLRHYPGDYCRELTSKSNQRKRCVTQIFRISGSEAFFSSEFPRVK